jgi:uncharacterized protein YprB with RNaseH-like and TPR domain
MSNPWTTKEEQELWGYVNGPSRLQYRTIAHYMGRSVDAIRNKVFQMRKLHGNDWLKEERIGFFDIEATHLKASIGQTISWAMKPMGETEKFFGWTRTEAISWDRMDRRIMKELIKELNNYDLIVTYYGTGFDNKFIRTRAMILGIPGFPTFGQLKHYDVYYSVKNKMSLHSNRLAVATQTLGIEGKTPLPPEIWGPGRLGYPRAMELIEEHNREDVKILEELYHEIVPYVQVQRKSI